MEAGNRRNLVRFAFLLCFLGVFRIFGIINDSLEPQESAGSASKRPILGDEWHSSKPEDASSSSKPSFANSLMILPPHNSPIWPYCQRFNTSTVDTGCLQPVDLWGSWHVAASHNKSVSHYAPVCCGRDGGQSSDARFQPDVCLEADSFNAENYVGAPFNFSVSQQRHQLINGNACTCHMYHDRYIWKSKSKEVFFDPISFCKQLGTNRTILFIGDSTMGQIASILMNSVLPGSCSPQLRYILSDTLILKPLGHLNRGMHWYEALKRYRPSYFVWSVGPHVYNETAWQVDVFESLLANMSHPATSQQFPSTTFVYRTHVPGGCTYHEDELSHLDQPDEAARSFNYSLRHNDHYNYDRFYGQDLYALMRLQQQPVLDLRPLYARSDSHPGSMVKKIPKKKRKDKRDCIHYCHPGPLDIVAPLLKEILDRYN